LTGRSRKYFGGKKFNDVYQKLIEAAKKRKFVCYKEIGKIMGIHKPGNYLGWETGRMLGEISKFEHEHGRPLLSAVVIRSDLKRPGDGFFKLAKELGKFKGESKEDQKKFWNRELQAVYTTWD
jgi:hypothetical protein